jgi:heat shock protein HtpX
MVIANMARWAAIFGGGGRDDRDNGSPIVLLVTALVAPFAAMLIQMAISRQREFAADHGAAELVGNPMGLVQALRKIDVVARRVPLDANPATAHLFIMNPFSMEGMSRLFSTHPSTEARIQALLADRA